MNYVLEVQLKGSLGGAAVWRLPLAQGAILETRDRIPLRAPGMEPASPSACVSASLSVTIIKKKLKKEVKNRATLRFQNCTEDTQRIQK